MAGILQQVAGDGAADRVRAQAAVVLDVLLAAAGPPGRFGGGGVAKTAEVMEVVVNGPDGETAQFSLEGPDVAVADALTAGIGVVLLPVKLLKGGQRLVKGRKGRPGLGLPAALVVFFEDRGEVAELDRVGVVEVAADAVVPLRIGRPDRPRKVGRHVAGAETDHLYAGIDLPDPLAGHPQDVGVILRRAPEVGFVGHLPVADLLPVMADQVVNVIPPDFEVPFLLLRLPALVGAAIRLQVGRRIVDEDLAQHHDFGVQDILERLVRPAVFARFRHHAFHPADALADHPVAVGPLQDCQRVWIGSGVGSHPAGFVEDIQVAVGRQYGKTEFVRSGRVLPGPGQHPEDAPAVERHRRFPAQMGFAPERYPEGLLPDRPVEVILDPPGCLQRAGILAGVVNQQFQVGRLVLVKDVAGLPAEDADLDAAPGSVRAGRFGPFQLEGVHPDVLGYRKVGLPDLLQARINLESQVDGAPLHVQADGPEVARSLGNVEGKGKTLPLGGEIGPAAAGRPPRTVLGGLLRMAEEAQVDAAGFVGLQVGREGVAARRQPVELALEAALVVETVVVAQGRVPHLDDRQPQRVTAVGGGAVVPLVDPDLAPAVADAQFE
ncbi:MAG: hypothetical protein BWY73_01256 [candidate division TA06 bacterium ADurb.Bin417]|uniref:Uncharacterized protein n=1 Tax=candidate division TA06 bacterium ADurb.Bin417 TaxID=1852828 RepID=A0A1V5MD38_UNCT6|nr:MAG: hypothetical protein BWY73_01256 [candidate division TA06 bacterium ADurb.Bin417]